MHTTNILVLPSSMVSLSVYLALTENQTQPLSGLLQEVSLARSDSHIASIGSPRQKKDRDKWGGSEIKLEAAVCVTLQPIVYPPHDHDAGDEDVKGGGIALIESEEMLFIRFFFLGEGFKQWDGEDKA